jgi:hypothetical protein
MAREKCLRWRAAVSGRLLVGDYAGPAASRIPVASRMLVDGARMQGYFLKYLVCFRVTRIGIASVAVRNVADGSRFKLPALQQWARRTDLTT